MIGNRSTVHTILQCSLLVISRKSQDGIYREMEGVQKHFQIIASVASVEYSTHHSFRDKTIPSKHVVHLFAAKIKGFTLTQAVG